MIMGEGKSPTKADLLKLAGVGNTKQDRALETIHQVSHATEKWDNFANEVGVSKLQIQNIREAIRTIRKNAGI